ncbi:MAG: chemotaxis protein CheB [Desulfuromonadaceae bacterium]|nr:chemotaxis protein CheB [Desulfuromonadaceae bacterium]
MNTKNAAQNFPVVCVGGSAGGLDAYTRLLQHLPADMGVAIVIVNHLRTVATMLHEILPKYTKMPVELITEKLDIQPDHVFIIPEKRDLHVLDGEFRLKPISKPHGWPDVITVFMRSLTEHWDGKLIAVIVSGLDGDGTAALCGIKDVGGITIAQKPDTAGELDMPESAIASGCIDFVLSPEAIAKEIIRIAQAESTEQYAQFVLIHDGSHNANTHRYTATPLQKQNYISWCTHEKLKTLTEFREIDKQHAVKR